MLALNCRTGPRPFALVSRTPTTDRRRGWRPVRRSYCHRRCSWTYASRQTCRRSWWFPSDSCSVADAETTVFYEQSETLHVQVTRDRALRVLGLNSRSGLILASGAALTSRGSRARFRAGSPAERKLPAAWRVARLPRTEGDPGAVAPQQDAGSFRRLDRPAGQLHHGGGRGRGHPRGWRGDRRRRNSSQLCVPEARFCGVSRPLLAALEVRAEERGAEKFRLESTETARRFYLANGYADDGRPSGKFGMTSGYRMAKPFAPRRP